jgi:MEMO1 family protein
MIRKPVAGQFYNGDLREQMEAFRARFQDTGGPERINAGIVPHAGWFFSGATAAGVFFAIQARQTPSTIILLGAVHTPGVLANSLFPEGF